MPVRKNFKIVGQAIIDALQPISDTNIEEGLRTGKVQLDAAPPRQSSLKLMVLFTDGRPTAFADNFGLDVDTCPADEWPKTKVDDKDENGTSDCYNGIVATHASGASYRGLFQRTDGSKVIGFALQQPLLTINGASTTSPKPRRLPNGNSVDGDNIRELGALQSEEWANTVRAAGYTIYAVGLGNPNATNELDAPDLGFLRRIANQDGISNGGQPRGELLFAPSPAELDATFAKLADRILTRLTQ